MPATRQITCQNGLVTALIAFVMARAREDRQAAERASSSSAGRALLDACDLADRLLDDAERTCEAAAPCGLSRRQLRGLAGLAILREGHPDFDPSWLRLTRSTSRAPWSPDRV